MIQTEERPVTLSESLALVERIAGSVELRRAARLRTFVIYVCDQTLNQGVNGMHEQEIGVAVFGRPASYDTGADNIVRVNATELRKRLEHYFLQEGAGEEIIVEIQRGSYRPVFRRRPPAALSPTALSASTSAIPSFRDSLQGVPALPEVLASDPDSVAAPETRPTRPETQRVLVQRPGLLAWQLGSFLLLMACGYLGLRWHEVAAHVEPWRHQSALRPFWQEFFASGAETNIVLADTSFAIAEDMMQRPVTLTDYLDYQYKRFAEAPGLNDSQRRDLNLVLERNTGSIADFRVGQQILALNPADPGHLALRFAREYTPGAAKRNSLILIGSRQSNPWVSLFADKLNFDLTYDVVRGRPAIVNRRPRAGEFAIYPASDGGDSAGTGYAVIGYLPGLSAETRTLIIEGTDSQATGAAGDFITSEESMRSLEAKLPAGRIPYFELVLRTSQVNGTPLHGEVIALRSYASP